VARSLPKARFDDLVRCATDAFIARGYRLTRMDDIADEVKVAKPTLYLYVESKEALFALCCEHADRSEALAIPSLLPVKTPQPGVVVSSLRRRFASAATFPALRKAIAAEPPNDFEFELRGVLGELFDAAETNCRLIKLVDRCSDHPEVGPIWEEEGRKTPRALLAQYLAAREAAGQLSQQHEPRLLARIAIETIVTWAIHIKWDRAPEHFDPAAVRAAVLDCATSGVLRAGIPSSGIA
jgi:AcrR family transcriptional regulator